MFVSGRADVNIPLRGRRSLAALRRSSSPARIFRTKIILFFEMDRFGRRFSAYWQIRGYFLVRLFCRMAVYRYLWRSKIRVTMNWKEIRREIDKLAELVEGWNASAEVPAVERDLALEQLRRLYEAIRFCTPAAGAAPDAGEPATEVAATPAPMPESPMPAVAEDPETIEASEVLDLNELLSLGAEPVFSEEPLRSEESMPSGPSEAPTLQPSESTVPVEETPASEPAVAPQPEEHAVETPAPTLVAETPAPAPAEPADALAGQGPAETPSAETSAPEAETQPSVPTFVSETDIAPAPAATYVAEPVAESVTELEPESAPAEAPAVPFVAPAPEADVAGPASAVPPTTEPTPVAEKPETPISEAKTAKGAPTLFGMEETVRHRHKQRVIMSLYDTPSDPEPPVRETAASRSSAASSMPFGLEPEPRPERVEPSAAQPAADTYEAYEPAVSHHVASGAHASEPAAAAGAVLGEVINHDVQTLADTIAPPRDVASELRRQEPVGDLRRAIGINDKFLLIRDLFAGDGAAYEQALDGLNACADLDDCMIFIAEHYAWNPESDGARLLMELLERKFS